MSKYFTYFPNTKYKLANNSFAKTEIISNISLRVTLLESFAQDDPYLYLRYVVKEGERAEDISNFYYDDPKYVWLIHFANDIVDPYEQWPKKDDDFKKYINSKYKNFSGDVDPVFWTQDETITANIKHYKNTSNNEWIISKDSYTLSQNLNPDFVAGDWQAVRYFEYENTLNEANRNILLINNKYLATAENNLKSLLNE